LKKLAENLFFGSARALILSALRFAFRRNFGRGAFRAAHFLCS
jgi:hypothetical protein